MLNSYPIYNPTTTNLRRNSLNSTLSLAKYRRNSFSPSTPLILSQSTFEDFHDDYFPNNNNNLPDLSTSSSIVSSSPSQSTIQCVRIIRRNDTAPIQTNSNPNQRRVVRVIRLSNAARSTEQTTSSSNVYIVRKTDLTPSVHINPALKDVIAKANNNNNNNSTDENNQINKFYGSTISIFGIEFTVLSNENNNNTDKCASLVQNMNDTMVKPNVQITNKVLFVFFFQDKKKFARIIFRYLD
jgi:hypothetical protein